VYLKIGQLVQNLNKTCNERITYDWGPYVQLLLQREGNNNYVLWACVCSLRHQHAMRLRRIVIFGLSGSKYFSTLSHKLQDLREKFWIWNVCFGFLYDFCPKHSNCRKNWSRYVQKCIFVFM